MPAGIDRFPRELVEQYFGGRPAPVPGVPVDRILALGAEDYEGGDPAVFNMAVMGFRLAQRANGVSELHGHVSAAGMFNGLWPAFDEAEVPIGSITNGVHAPTWVAREVFELAAAQGADRDVRRRRRLLGRWSTRSRATDIWDAQAPAARAARRRRPRAAGPVVAEARRRARPSSAGSTPRSTPTC